METTLKDQFITLWDTYFPQAGLPITFEYSADTQNSGSGSSERTSVYHCPTDTSTTRKNSLYTGRFCGMPGWKTVYKLYGQDVPRV